MSIDERPRDNPTTKNHPDSRDRPGTGRVPHLYAAIFGQMALLIGFAYFFVPHLQQ